MHREAARFHDDVVIDNFLAGVPARRDLDAIIELSESIGKGSDKLKRPIKS